MKEWPGKKKKGPTFNITCDDIAKSNSLLQAVIANIPSKPPDTSKQCEFISWRISIWLQTDHWLRINGLLQIDQWATRIGVGGVGGWVGVPL